jgi:hypothetical protein
MLCPGSPNLSDRAQECCDGHDATRDPAKCSRRLRPRLQILGFDAFRWHCRTMTGSNRGHRAGGEASPVPTPMGIDPQSRRRGTRLQQT